MNPYSKEYQQALENKQNIESVTDVANSAVNMGLNFVLPGLGSAIGAAQGISEKLTKNEDGTYKSTFAHVADAFINPIGAISQIGQDKKIKEAEEKLRYIPVETPSLQQQYSQMPTGKTMRGADGKSYGFKAADNPYLINSGGQG
jgi:hypothetical protein